MDNDESIIDKLKADAEALLAGTTASSILMGAGNVTNRLLNKYTPQDTPIGEIFADFAIDRIKQNSNIPVDIAYVQKYPRVYSDAIPESMRTPLGDFVADAFLSNGANVDKFIKERPEELGELIDEFRRAGTEHLQNELNGAIPADKLRKFNNVVGDVLNKEFTPSADINFIVHAPRNNLATAAHEFGHIVNDTSAYADSINDTSVLGKIRNAARSIWDNVGVKSITESSLVPESIRNGIFDRVNSIKNPILRNAATMLTSTGMPTALTLATLPFTTSKTFRDAVGSLDSSGNTQEVMDWIGDNAVTVSALAAAPRLIEEAATTIPGYKLTVDFWNEFNKGANGALKDHPLMREAAGLVGKKTPWLEGLKFIGRNSLHFLPALAPVAVAAISSYMNSGGTDDGN